MTNKCKSDLPNSFICLGGWTEEWRGDTPSAGRFWVEEWEYKKDGNSSLDFSQFLLIAPHPQGNSHLPRGQNSLLLQWELHLSQEYKGNETQS